MSDSEGLNVPFTAVQSVGGPYEDAAFCAGYSVGFVGGILSIGELDLAKALIEDDLLHQMDLIAMMYKYTMTITEQAGGWSTVIFRKQREFS